MILPTKKTLLNRSIILFICLTAYPINKSLDDAGWSLSTDTPTHTCDTTTHTHEFFVTHHEDYDTYIEHCINKETQEFIYYSNNLYHDELNTPELNSSSDTIDAPDIIPTHDLLNDFALETRKQEIGENQAAQIEAHNNKHFTTGKIIQELKIPKDRILYLKDVEGHILDSTIILDKTHTIQDLIKALNSPIIKARFERINRSIERRNIPKKGHDHKSKKELDFLDLLISGHITGLLEQIMHPDLNVAQSAFEELKRLWPWKREHTFLGVDLKYGTGEPGFVNAILGGVDIMKITEKKLITHKDYIAKYTTTQGQKTIQEYREACYLLQQKGNQTELFNQKQQLYQCINKNSIKNDLVANICFAIAENCWLNPITRIFDSIAHAPSLEKACDHLKNLEKQILIQAQQDGITPMPEVRAWVIDHYGFDVLDAAQNCYKSRSDYVYTPNNQSYLSDTIQPILNNIGSKSLPGAHAELVHLKKQVDKALAEHNITDPIAQKKFIEKSLGRDVLGLAHKKYEARLDHKKLVGSFVDIDVNQETATILQNNNSYESVANGMSDLAERIFGNARLCNLSNLPTIESHVNDTIDAMRLAQNHPTFIFNFSMVNRTLGDIQQLAHAIFSGTHPVLERSSELLMRGFSKFFTELNPLTQASNMGHLAYDLGKFLKKSGSALWNDPINVMHNGMNTTCSLIDLIRSTADFVSDLTVGKLYLPAEVYQQRIDTFCTLIEPLKGITAEHCVEFAAQLAADTLTLKGIGRAYTFLKEIDALEKLGESAATVARAFKKGFDTHLGDNPVVITAEGIVLKMSNGMKDFNKGPHEIINSAKALFESAYAPIAKKLEDAISKIRTFYKRTPNYDIPNFGNKEIQVALEHVLGVELKWSELGTLLDLSGFHHDFMGAVEKSKAFKFLNKIVNENGCYSADIVLNGKSFPKTFFPQHWSQEDVVKKIYEAYYNFRKSGAIALEKGGKYLIDGVTNEGITIRMYVTKGGKIVTAYPKLRP